MRTFLLTVICSAFVLVSFAQNKPACNFEKLLGIGANSSKETVLDTVKSIYGLSPFSTSQIKKAAARGKDSVAIDLLFYKIESVNCLKGSNSIMQFKFTGNKLVTALIYTKYAKADYYDMQDNLNALRSNLQSIYPYEKQVNNTISNLTATGYDFSSSRNMKTGKVSLQSITTKDDKGIYILRMLWANVNDTGIEDIQY